MTGIYLITNIANGKRYVGASKNIRRRYWDHKRPHAKSPLALDIQKLGSDMFTKEVLEQCSVEELRIKEKEWIERLSPEYNIYNGSIGVGNCVPEDVRKRISQSVKQHWESLPTEDKERVIKEQLIGPRVGHEVSPETRSKLRKANIGKKQSVETINKRSESFKRRREQGIHRSGESHFKKVVCINTGVIYESVKAAAVAIGVHPSSITSVLKGRQQTCKGFHFKYCGVETIRDECNEVGLG